HRPRDVRDLDRGLRRCGRVQAPRRQARARDPQVEAHAGRGAHMAPRRAEPREVRGALEARRPDPAALARGPGQARPGIENQGARNLRVGPQSYPATTISPPGCGCRTTAKAPAMVLGPEAARVTMPPVPNPVIGSASSELSAL